MSKRFAGMPALREVEFSLMRGQVHALAGASGAGKSTLVKVLTGVCLPDKGMLFHRGEPVRFTGPQDARARGINAVYQEANLIDSMSVSANVFLGREPRNRLGLLSSRQMHARTTRLLHELGIDIDPCRPVHTLGRGAQQMVAIARSVSTDARVVVMDEPTAGLQPPEVETLFDVIRRLHERDVAVVYVSRRLVELFQICNAITVLRDGMVVHTGPMSGIGPHELVSTMLGLDPADVRRAGSLKYQAALAEAVNAHEQATRAEG
ncbi:MAG: ATP-binding cassette domain-containing protein [Kibdelosporangium sp.]